VIDHKITDKVFGGGNFATTVALTFGGLETPFFAFFRSRQYKTIACEKKSQIGAVLRVLEGSF